MSRTLTIDRSNAKSAILAKWITGGFLYPGDDVCEVVIDGRTQIIKWESDFPNDIAGVYWAYVREGDEIGPAGNLLEYSTSSGGRDPRTNFIGDEHVRQTAGWTPNPESLGRPPGPDTVDAAELRRRKEDPNEVAEDADARAKRLRESIHRVTNAHWLQYVKNRVSTDAHALLEYSSKFRSQFLTDADCHAF